jgi:hypothetical protein
MRMDLWQEYQALRRYAQDLIKFYNHPELFGRTDKETLILGRQFHGFTDKQPVISNVNNIRRRIQVLREAFRSLPPTKIVQARDDGRSLAAKTITLMLPSVKWPVVSFVDPGEHAYIRRNSKDVTVYLDQDWGVSSARLTRIYAAQLGMIEKTVKGSKKRSSYTTKTPRPPSRFILHSRRVYYDKDFLEVHEVRTIQFKPNAVVESATEYMGVNAVAKVCIFGPKLLAVKNSLQKALALKVDAVISESIIVDE